MWKKKNVICNLHCVMDFPSNWYSIQELVLWLYIILLSFLYTNFGLQKYLLLLKNSEQRKNLTRLRISAHRLHIEQGRYQGIPRQNRICNRCTSNEIDDEVHFLFSCTSSQDDRYYMNSKINSLCSNFNSLNSNQKLIWLLNTENVEILISVCNLISKSKI